MLDGCARESSFTANKTRDNQSETPAKEWMELRGEEKGSKVDDAAQRSRVARVKSRTQTF